MTRSSTSPGASDRVGREARRTLRVAAITIAAGTPLSVTSPTTSPTLPSGELDEVVEVAADRAGRPVVGGHLPAGEVGELFRQEVLLDQARDLELLLDPLARPDLDLLLADELADAHGRSGLGGEVVEQLPIVARVRLVGQPRARGSEARSARPG